jgi:co-chaperonin GroES (HSP10)
MNKIKPTRSSLLGEPIRHSTETVRGLHIPEAHREQQLSIDCIVLEKGPKAIADVRCGDRVLIERFKGTEVRQGKRVFIIIPSNEVLAIIE